MNDHETATYRLCLHKGEGRVRVARFEIARLATPRLNPLPSRRGEADTLSAINS
jgi:hypothetical protein